MREFQRRHGLPATGRVEEKTVEAVRIPIAERIEQITANMERCANEDILPKLRSDASYLKKNNFRLYRGWGANAAEVDPQSVSWKSPPRRSVAAVLITQHSADGPL